MRQLTSRPRKRGLIAGPLLTVAVVKALISAIEDVFSFDMLKRCARCYFLIAPDDETGVVIEARSEIASAAAFGCY